MKVAFYVYPVAFQSPGGGEILLLKTREYLEKEGLSVKLFDPWNDKLRDFDILHTFGSVKDSLRMMRTAAQLSVKNVLSTICWYSWKSAWGTYPSFSGRSISLVRQATKSFFPFMPSQRKEMMSCADILLPNSESEARQLKSFFKVSEEKIMMVPNAVDESFAKASPDAFISKFGLKDFILCVGRIEPRKNQLNVIRALKGISQSVVIIGDYVPYYKAYYDQCRKEAGNKVHFLGGFSHESPMLASAYAACNTFLLATWLETPGLAALEAALAGAKVVITREGATREYFQKYVRYVSPDNLEEIRKEVQASYNSPLTLDLKNHIQSRFLWDRAAKLNIKAYERVLK